ncbi:MAG: two-component regulator propeller domain-containing protein [Bacteroidota bacterium]
MRRTLALLLLLASSSLNAQEIPIGTWRTHFSYNQVRLVEVANNAIYAASSSGLFIYSLDDNSIMTVTNLNGLQELDISALYYNSAQSTLLIGYESGNLDVIHGNEIINIDLTTDSQVQGSKSINNIISEGRFTYLFTDFGLLKMDSENFAVSETIREIGMNNSSIVVNQGAIRNDSLFLATEEGIYATNIVTNINLADPSVWNIFDEPDGLFIGEFQFIVNLQNDLIAGSTGMGIYRYGDTWSAESVLIDESFLRARVIDARISVVTELAVFQLDSDLNSTEIIDEMITTPLDALTLGSTIYVGDEANGLLKIEGGGSESILPSGPISNSIFKLTVQSNGIYGFAGGFSNSVTPARREGAFYIFNESQWNSVSSGQTVDFEDAVDGVYQSSQNRTVIALAGEGLLIINDDNTSEIIDDTSTGSTLVNIDSSDKGVIIPSLYEDSDGIWVLNYNAVTPLHLFSAETWSAFSLIDRQVYQIVGDNRHLYMISNQGVVVFEKSTGNSRLLTDDPGFGGLASDNVNSIAVDREGLVWVGTDEGVSVFSNPSALMEGDVDAVEPIFENRPLLRDENITAIAVDGGDRKWIGTNSGIWLFDAQADRQLLNFTVDNSPLSSNEILDIAVDPNSGEVFFATPFGIVSYREGATRASNVHQNVKVFPNPITADFVGTVGISGLAEDAQVKITDASGKLIWQTRAAGGTATWNARDYNGNRASSGVYFIFSSDDEGEETFIGKIAVVN